MRFILLGLISLLFFFSAGSRAAPQPNTLVAERLEAVAAGSGTSLEFREYRTSSLFTEPVVYTGRLEVNLSENSLTKWIDSPEPARMTLTATDIEMQTGESRVRRISLRQRPEMAAFVSSMLSLMQGDVDALEKVFDVLYWELPDSTWKLRLRPRERRVASRVSELTISGCSDQLQKLTTEMADGDVQTLEIISSLAECGSPNDDP